MTRTFAVIDIAERWPGKELAYPRTILDYSITGGQVLGVVHTWEEAVEILSNLQDHSGRQRFRIASWQESPDDWRIVEEKV